MTQFNRSFLLNKFHKHFTGKARQRYLVLLLQQECCPAENLLLRNCLNCVIASIKINIDCDRTMQENNQGIRINFYVL